MGGFWSSPTYLEEWKADDQYNNSLVNARENTAIPYSVDLSYEFKDLHPVGDTNDVLCADLLLKYIIKQQNVDMQCNKITLLNEKNSLFTVLSTVKAGHSTVNISPVNRRNIKHHIKDSEPVFILMKVSGYDLESTEYDPLDQVVDDNSEFALAGLIVAYKNKTFQIITGYSKPVFVTHGYILNNTKELWTLSVNSLPEQELVIPLDFLPDNQSDNSIPGTEPGNQSDNSIPGTEHDNQSDNQSGENLDYKIAEVNELIDTLSEPIVVKQTKRSKSRKRQDRRKKSSRRYSMISDDFDI